MSRHESLTKMQIELLNHAKSIIRQSQELIELSPQLYSKHDDAMAYIQDILDDYSPR